MDNMNIYLFWFPKKKKSIFQILANQICVKKKNILDKLSKDIT
jgi:hypothetical protein